MTLLQKCLALTGSFETSTGVPDCYAGIAGDFDGQGLSFGALQWNIGQGTLQPMLAEMLANHQDAFQEHYDAVRTMLAAALGEQLAWARSIQDPVHHTIHEPWLGLFKALGRTPEFQAIQVKHAVAIHQRALALCRQFGLSSERGLALMFDICVQNGSISLQTEAKIRADFAAGANSEVAKLQSIANRRAEATKAQFVEDVRTRKLTIANGQGMVHGRPYDLGSEFGIGLEPIDIA